MKAGRKYDIGGKLTALVLSLTMILSLWSVPVKAATRIFSQTIAATGNYDGNTIYAIQEDGSLWSWGRNQEGQVGNDSTDAKILTPQKVLEGVVSVTAGEGSAYAIREDGSLWRWGRKLETPGSSLVRHPERVPHLQDVKSVVFNAGNFYAIQEDGSLWAWGLNSYGQLGDGTTNDSVDPVRVLNVNNVEQLFFKGESVFAIESNGNLWAWGNNHYGLVAPGSTNPVHPTPVQIPAVTDVTEIAIKSDMVYALTRSGRVWFWGTSIQNPRLYQITDVKSIMAVDHVGLYIIKDDDSLWEITGTSVTPILTQILAGVRQMLHQDGSYYAVQNDGKLWAWGANESGQLGLGFLGSVTAPQQVAIGNVQRLMSVDKNVFVILADSSVWSWGRNSKGQVGSGSTGQQLTPQKALDGVRDIIADRTNAYALGTDGSLWGWGWNGFGQLGNNSTNDSYAPVQIIANNMAQPGNSIVSPALTPYSPDSSENDSNNQPDLPVNVEKLSDALEAAVRRELGKFSGELTDSDWLSLTKLDLSGQHLISLGGLEKAKNLEQLDLSFAQVDDILVLSLMSGQRTVTLKNSNVAENQIKQVQRKQPQTKFRILTVSISDSKVKLWNTNQIGDELVASAEEIIVEAGRQHLGTMTGPFIINKPLAKSGAQKAEAIKEQLNAKAALERRELPRNLETIVRVTLTMPKDQTSAVIRLAENVKEVTEMDRLIIEVQPDIAIELSAEDLQDAMTGDMEIEITEVKAGAKISLPADQVYAFGGDTKKSKTYQIKMKKNKKNSKVGVSLKTDADPYNALCRKDAEGKEEVVGGKYDSRTKKLSAKISDDGEYYVRKNEKNFADIEGLPAKEKEIIKILASKGILQGSSNGQFMPNETVKRSEILTILVRMSYSYDGGAASKFFDVAKNAWYYPYVSSGVKLGVVNGYPDNSFKPGNSVGAAELAKMNSMMLVYKKGYHFPKELQKYLAKLAQNSNVPTWAKTYIAMAEREGFLLKAANGFYDGGQAMTRKQAAEMLYRLYEKL